MATQQGDSQDAPRGAGQPKAPRRRTAGAFDIRMIIGALLGIYGVVLVLLGLFHATEAELDRADGLNVNLWAGAGMVVVALAFGAWTRMKPTVVPEDFEDAEDDHDGLGDRRDDTQG